MVDQAVKHIFSCLMICLSIKILRVWLYQFPEFFLIISVLFFLSVCQITIFLMIFVCPRCSLFNPSWWRIEEFSAYNFRAMTLSYLGCGIVTTVVSRCKFTNILFKKVWKWYIGRGWDEVTFLHWCFAISIVKVHDQTHPNALCCCPNIPLLRQ